MLSNARLSALSLGMAFLLTGFGFAFPLALFTEDLLAAFPARAPEALNLFCFVAWLGLAHFYFAYRGHFVSQARAGGIWTYLGILVLSASALFGLRAGIGLGLFSAIAWVYFISHLVKAELFFAGEREWRAFLFPLLAFSYFSYVLLVPPEWLTDGALFAGALLCFSPLLLKGVRERRREFLVDPVFLVTAFLVGETLLWGRYRPWMTEGFRDGVYTIHVALASFYHYLRSYLFMHERGQGDWLKIATVNVVVIACGLATLKLAETSPLFFLFGPQFFTVWVWLHQWMSDVHNWRRSKS